jgi:hypothetical protein
MVPCTRASGTTTSDVGKVYRFGLMVRNMREIGSITSSMGMAKYGDQMVTSTTEIGRMTNIKDTASLFLFQDTSTKVGGKMIFNMDKAKNSGQTDLNTVDIIMKVKNTALENITGATGVATRATGK